MFFHNRFIELLEARGAAEVALQRGDELVRVGQLLAESQQLAAQLWRVGCRAGDRLVMASEPGPDFLRLIFATMILQCQVAIIDPEMGRDNYREKLRQFAPQWAIVDTRLLFLREHPLLRWIYLRWNKSGPYFPQTDAVKLISTGPRLPLWQKHQTLRQLKRAAPLPFNWQNGNPDHPYLVTYTSGTQSVPKGVVHRLSSLAHSIELIVDLLRSLGPQRVATHLPHFMLIGVCAGIPVHLWRPRATAAERLAFIRDQKISILFGPPAEYLELLGELQKRGEERFPDCLQHVLLGSAPVHVPFLERLIERLPAHTRITCLYGMTENLLVSTCDGRQKVEYPCRGDLLGRPAAGVNLEIAADGEILIQSPQLYRNYWHLNSRPHWHPTGDLGYLDEEQLLVLTGRKKEMIIRRNFNLYPALYEPTVKKIPGVTEAVFVGIYEEVLADEVVFLVIEGNEKLPLADLEKKLQRGIFSIDREAWPDRILQMAIPRSGRQQKVDRRTLKAQIRQNYSKQ
ncbi:MAG: class I adenylate-forming enzyme family protein [Bacteroidota bacterium]